MQMGYMTPDRLYKYRADADFTVKSLIDREVWLSTPDALNDPLECKTGLIPDSWKKQVIRKEEEGQFLGLFVDLFMRPTDTLFSMNSIETKLWRRAFSKLSHERKVRRMHELYQKHGSRISNKKKMFEVFERQLETVGILSLSASETQQLMWAHYADSHRGLALGFAVEEGFSLADTKHLLKVTYDDEKPISSTGHRAELSFSKTVTGLNVESRFSFEDPLFRAAISTKPKEWAYEQEWRYVHERTGAHPWPGRLVSVTFGNKMPIARRKFYAGIIAAQSADVEIKEIVLAKNNLFKSINLNAANL